MTLPARDGLELAGTLYQAEGAEDSPRAVVLTSATAVKRQFYDSFARFLADRGFAVLIFDYRGIGGSRRESLRGCKASMHAWGEEDIAGAIDWMAGRFPRRRLFGIGHSAGGQLIGLAANNDRLAGLVNVAAQSGYWGLWPFPGKFALAFLWYVAMPSLARLLGRFPSSWLRLGEDLPAGVALEWARWCRDPRFLAGRARRASVEHFGQFRAPLLAYSFDDDPFAPRAAVDWMTDCYQAAPRERRHLETARLGQPVGHFGFFRHRLRDPLWTGAAAWIEAQ